jgi:RNA polymerase sigma factor (sigma-70 family)
MPEDKRALVERLFAQHSGALRVFFHRRAGLRADASALSQEVYLRLLHVNHIDSIKNPEAYLFTVASNLAKEQKVLEWRRGIAVDLNDPTVQEQLGSLDETGSKIDHEHRVARLREVLGQLSPKCRAVVVLQYWHGMSYEDIASRLGISTHMVKKYLVQGLGLCRRRMARME